NDAGMAYPEESGGFRYSWMGFNGILHSLGDDQLERASELVMLSDTIFGWLNPRLGSFRVYWREMGANDWGVPHARHNGAANIHWVDGHGSAVQSPDPANIESIFEVLPRRNFDPSRP